MTAHIKLGGTWQSVSQPHVKVGGTWQSCSAVYVKVGGAWQQVWSSGGGETVSPRADGDTNSNLDSPGPVECWVGPSFYNDGNEYERTPTGGYGNVTTWLDSGSASNVWVEFVRTAGATQWSSGHQSGTRYNLGTTRHFYGYVSTFSSATWSITGYFRMWPAASGGTALWTGSTVLWQADAEVFGGPCPLCCFTPDTLIALPSGLEMPISQVKKGDMIMGVNGPQEVTEVIVREETPMFDIKLEDGRRVTASPDHPFVTEDGWACVVPMGPYKGLGVPDKLKVGDRVWVEEGKWVKITSIKYSHKEPVVYTFENSLFYANGILVY